MPPSASVSLCWLRPRDINRRVQQINCAHAHTWRWRGLARLATGYAATSAPTSHTHAFAFAIRRMSAICASCCSHAFQPGMPCTAFGEVFATRDTVPAAIPHTCTHTRILTLCDVVYTRYTQRFVLCCGLRQCGPLRGACHCADHIPRYGSTAATRHKMNSPTEGRPRDNVARSHEKLAAP